MPVAMPDVASLQDLKPMELESKVNRHFDHQVENYFSEDRPNIPIDEDLPVARLGHTVEPLQVQNRVQMEMAVNSVRDYWGKRAEAEETSKALKKVPMSMATPSTLASVAQSAVASVGGLSPDDLERKAQQNYDQLMRQNSSLAFYDAVGEYWNDDLCGAISS